MGVFALRRLDDGGLEVELDAGHVAAFHPAPPGAALPDGLAGMYRSDEMDATWTITTVGTVEDASDGMQVTAHGPVVRGGAWRIEPILDDFVRVHAPDLLFPTWLDVRAVRNDAGQVTGLEVSGGRVKRVLYQRVPE